MRIKERFEDFKVTEVMDLLVESRGRYIYFILRKEGWNTLRAIEAIASKLGVKVNHFGFAGLKDKKAVTEQYASVYGVKRENLENIKINGISIKVLGRGKIPISLGDLKRNRFEVFVKGEKINESDFFVNYFGEQRFGKDGGNILVGKSILKREFKEACNLLNLDVGSNYLGNLKSLGRKKLSLYLHAYQSYLWNKVVGDVIKKAHPEKVGLVVKGYVFLKEKISNFRVPLANFDVDIYDDYLKEDGLKKEDFILREIPELVNETVFRDVLVNVDDLEISKKEEGFLVKFTLPKGSYATVYLSKLFI